MKKYIIALIAFATITSACDFLDMEMEQNYGEDMFLNSGLDYILGYGMETYNYLQGHNSVAGTLLAAACDEADYSQVSDIQKFNTGAWGPFSNPDDKWGHYYKGIRHATLFLQQTTNYPELLVKDTIKNKTIWLRDCDNIKKLRAEAKLLRAYFYMELVRRYGGVPIVTRVMSINDDLKIPRNTMDECVKYICDQCDEAYPDLAKHYTKFGYNGDNYGDGNQGTDNTWQGRLDKPVAKALKVRALLYAASKLHNPSNNVDKWKAAAKAGHDFMTDPNCAHVRYRANNTVAYGNLFHCQYDNNVLTPNADKQLGIIMTRPYEKNSNSFEKANYPVGMTNAQGKAVCPSLNLIKACGAKIPSYNPAVNPLTKLGRGDYMVVVPGSNMGKVNNVVRPVDSYVGGVDGIGSRYGATTTGIYLKKFLCPEFDIVKGDNKSKSWALMRYEEVLLNMAEAMSEAYGPYAKGNLDGLDYAWSAADLTKIVTSGTKYNSPNVPDGLTPKEFSDWLREERRVELAFEGYRFFDVRRWMIAEDTENQPLLGIKVYKEGNNVRYEEFVVEQRVFIAPKMYLYPIPFSEINKSNGVIVQNPGW